MEWDLKIDEQFLNLNYFNLCDRLKIEYETLIKW